MTVRVPISVLLQRIRCNWPEAATPETDIVFSIMRFQELIRLRSEEVLAEFKLTHAAFEVLVALRAQPAPRQMTPTELYRSVLLSSGGTTKILIELERQGFVERIPNPEDGRSRIVLLTRMGEQTVEKAMQRVMQGDKAHFANFDDSKEIFKLRDVLTASMEKVEGPSEN